MAVLFTIGYGGVRPSEFVQRLQAHGVGTLADVRIRPERAALGSFVKAKTATKGIEGLLAGSGIDYVSLLELGNPYLGEQGWAESYRLLIEKEGEVRTERLLTLPGPVCLLCAEKDPAACHRTIAANWLAEHHAFEIIDITASRT